MIDMIHYNKFPFTELKGNYRVQRSLPGIPVMNQTHPIQISHFVLLIHILHRVFHNVLCDYKHL